MNQHPQSDRRNLVRNFILAVIVASGVWYYMQPPAHKASANPKAEILEIGIANAGSFQISMWVPSGSTSDSVPGIAHVVEHLKFKTNDGAGFTGFDAIPGSSSNAATSYQTTRYDLNVPPEGVDKALENLAASLLPMKITEADLKLEKTVVQQELLQRTQSEPDTPFFQDFYAKLYHGLPYEHSPGGTQSSVAGVSMQNVMDFDAAHYTGSKVFVLISGPELEAKQWSVVEKLFPESAIAKITIARDFKVQRIDEELKALPAFLNAVKVSDISQEEITAEKTSPRAQSTKLTYVRLVTAPTDWQAVLAASILRSAVVSRLPDGLHDKIAEDHRLVQSWSFSVDRLFDGMWQITFSADVENGVDPKNVRAAFEAYFAELSKTGLSNISFERLKERNFLLNEWENASSRANSLAEDSLIFGYTKASALMENLHAVKVGDVNALLKLLQKPGRVGVALLKPEGTAQ